MRSVSGSSLSAAPSWCGSLVVTRRAVVQHSGSGPGRSTNGLRSVLDQYADLQVIKKLRANARGNGYRFQYHKLWPSAVSLEAAWTAEAYDIVERTPLHRLQLSSGVPPSHSATSSSGLIPEAALSGSQGDIPHRSVVDTAPPTLDLLSTDGSRVKQESLLPSEAADETGLRRKRLLQMDLIDTPLSSLLPPTGVGTNSSIASKPGDAAGISWQALGLDPELTAAVMDYWSRHASSSPVEGAPSSSRPTQVQARLLPALLHEDHLDVLFSVPRGTGGSTSLLLALLHGVRTENAGMNIFVAKDVESAERVQETLLALLRRLPSSDGRTPAAPDWLYCSADPFHYQKAYLHLQRSLENTASVSSTPVRLFITTAEMLCQLFFEKKLEFEPFGYLRRVYLDDITEQIPMLADNASVSEVRERLRNPLAAELLLGTLHQLPGPHIRSILQLGLVASGVSPQLRDHLQALCLKPTAHTSVLAPVRLSTTLHCLFSFYYPSVQASGIASGVRGLPSAEAESSHPSSSAPLHTVLSSESSGLIALELSAGGRASKRSTTFASASSPTALLWWHTRDLRRLRETLTYAAALLWRARAKIPGRVLVFVEDTTDLLRARQALQAAGLDVKLLHEVFQNGRWVGEHEEGGQDSAAPPPPAPWRFLLLRQHECVGDVLPKHPVPYVSHAVICFPPASPQAYQHMAQCVVDSSTRAAKQNVGWVWVVSDTPRAKAVRQVVEAAGVTDFLQHTVNEHLEQVSPALMQRLTRAPSLYGMDPQFAVQQHYEVQSENPEVGYQPKEFFASFSRSHVSRHSEAMRRKQNKLFQKEDYTPVPTKMREWKNAKRLANDVQRDPARSIERLKHQQLVDPSTLRPTPRLRHWLRQKS